MASSEMTLQEISRPAMRATERDTVWGKSAEFAREFWKRLVNNVGEPDARDIMHHVMGEKKPGRRRTDKDYAMIAFIYGYIRRHRDLTDGRIAKQIFESKPFYVQYESGAFAIVNNEITEAYMTFPDDPIVERSPFKKSLTAIQKQVERTRRWTIAEAILPKEYAPRNYVRS
jgi:hypothetical protein